MQPLDDYDRALLRLLQQDNKLTTEELSNQVSLSQSAIQRRIKRLRETGIIEADIAIVSPSVAGISITCIVDIVLHEGNSRAIDGFKKTIVRCPEVSQCYYVTGTYDFVLVVNVRDMAHFEEFQKYNLMDNPNLKHFYTHVVMDKVKVGYSVPL